MTKKIFGIFTDGYSNEYNYPLSHRKGILTSTDSAMSKLAIRIYELCITLYMGYTHSGLRHLSGILRVVTNPIKFINLILRVVLLKKIKGMGFFGVSLKRSKETNPNKFINLISRGVLLKKIKGMGFWGFY